MIEDDLEIIETGLSEILNELGILTSERMKYKKALQDIVCLGTGNPNKVFIQQFNAQAIEIAKEALK